ncbi:MAG: hypothetical protein J6J60_00275 [Clostridia bacterium]|nr:hypothetical protein [Clostridia bacterium]
MNKDYMITQKDIVKERFNSEKIECDNIELFLSYFLVVLERAVQFKLIDSYRRDKIFELLFKVFEKNTNENCILISNKMYVFSDWLISLTNYEAFEKLEQINDENSATQIFDLAEKNFFSNLRAMRRYLQCAERSINKIQNSNCKDIHAKLKNIICCMEKYSEIPSISFKNEHISRSFSVLEYIFLREESGKTIIEMLKNICYNFAMELQIFSKLDGKQFIEFSNSDYEKKEKEKEQAQIQLSKMFEIQLKELQTEKKQKLHSAMLFNQAYDNMTTEERNMVSNEELDKTDEVRIERDYAIKLEEIKTKWTVAEKNLGKAFEIESQLEGSLAIQDTNLNLSVCLQELALISLFKRGIINYPENRLQKGVLLGEISVEFAIFEFLNFCDAYSLLESEKKFLQKSIEFKDFSVDLRKIKKVSEEIENLNHLELLEYAKKSGYII